MSHLLPSRVREEFHVGAAIAGLSFGSEHWEAMEGMHREDALPHCGEC